MSGPVEYIHTPVLIVGGGPAGSAAAITLARGGQTSLVIERTQAASQVVCGGFLGWDALAALRNLGVDAGTLGARPISRVRLMTRRRFVEADLPHAAAGLSRRTLDAALLAAAEAAGARVMRGRAVRAAEPSGRSVRTGDGDTITCDTLLLATGKHDLRGLARDLSGYSDTPAVGMRMVLPPSPAREQALAGVVELHLFSRGYAGLLLQEDGTANLCLSVSPDRFRAAGGARTLIAEIMHEAPRLADRLGSDLPSGFTAIAGVPYGWRARQTQPGIFRVGDQGAVIASLVGDGIAIALTSGQDAALALLTNGAGAAPDWQRRFSTRARRAIGVAETLRHGAARPLAADVFIQLTRLVPGLSRFAARITRI